MKYIIIVILLVLSAFFSASETSFSTVNKIRLRAMADEGDKKAARALKIAENFDKTLTTILVGNNIVNILSASLGTVIFTELFGSAGVGIATAVMTILVLIFGEILPKSIAKENAEAFALSFGGILNFLIIVFTPVSAIFMWLKSLLSKKDEAEKPSVTEDELKYIIDEIEAQGVLEEQESDLVRSALEFDEKKVEKILVPRVKICAIEKNSDFEAIKNCFVAEGFSRLPVYDKSIDNIVGIITEKDFFRIISESEDGDRRTAEDIMQNVLHFSEFMLISEALKEMQKHKQHIAVINDQYGGTCGLVTLEDIIEELVGEIYDESDEMDKSCIKLSDGKFEVEGSLSISDMVEKTGIEEKFVKTESNTVGGWAMELFGRIPESGDSISDGIIKLTITNADESHIERMIIEYLAKENENGNLS